MFDELFDEDGFTLDRLRSLCEVAEKGSIGEATKGNSNKQSQFSRQIGDLKNFFGVDMLNRDSRPFRLSPEGKELARLTRAYLTSVSDFRASCNDLPVTLTIGSGESVIQWRLLPGLNHLQEKIPEASVVLRNLRTMEVVEGLLDGEIDLGLIRKTAVSKPLRSEKFTDYGYRLFVPGDLKRKMEPKIKIQDFANLPLAVIIGAGEFRGQLEALARDAGVTLNIRLECSSYPQVATAIDSGYYCGVLPAFAGDRLTNRKVTAHEVIGFENLKRDLVFAWNPKNQRKVLRKVVNLLKNK